MFATRNDLAPEIRQRAIAFLNQHLADTSDLYSQAKQARWNVKAMRIFQLHELVGRLADAVEEYVDLIAERVVALGGLALGTVRLSAAASRLPEYPLDAVDGREHLEALAARVAVLTQSSRAAIDAAGSLGDADTADLFRRMARELDEQWWLMESHLSE